MKALVITRICRTFFSFKTKNVVNFKFLLVTEFQILIPSDNSRPLCFDGSRLIKQSQSDITVRYRCVRSLQTKKKCQPVVKKKTQSTFKNKRKHRFYSIYPDVSGLQDRDSEAVSRRMVTKWDVHFARWSNGRWIFTDVLRYYLLSKENLIR